VMLRSSTGRVPKKGTASREAQAAKADESALQGFAETGSTVFDSSRAVIVHTKLTASVHF